MNKKAYFKVIEVMIAVFILFFVIVFVTSRTSYFSEPTEYELIPLNMVDDNLRQSIINHETSVINKKINETNPDFIRNYNYFITYNEFISKEQLKDIAASDVNVYTLFVSGNYTDYNPTILRIYYWKKR